MQQYFATFPAGCYAIIIKQLKNFPISELEILEHDESSVTFRTSLSVEKLIEVRYFTNVYVTYTSTTPFPKELLKGRYFRLMGLVNGAPKQLTSEVRQTIERQIMKDLKLTAHTHLSRNDFYSITRASGIAILALRLPRAKFKREVLQSGELRPELAHILCLAAGLKAKHLFVDMFAGYGAIPLEAVRGFGCRNVIASDQTVLSSRHEHPAVTWYTADARKLSFITDATVDRVVTDPPWGKYEAQLDGVATLYQGVFKEIARILKRDGVAVIVSAYEDVPAYLAKETSLHKINQWNILVSGKKATVYKLQKV